ncbi:ABC transporter ATP-binding protein [Yoonia sp. GPGPB17]|uniref:ABC transporter ATP-binding protein n=1 Tax=Yoonia sp. GPGPB17 TaxID=3026147 RepID=UPI0030BA49B1
MTLLQLRDLGVTLRKQRILSNVNIEVAEGEVIGLIGPNGAGKTTLMRAVLSLLPHEGHSSIAAMSARDRGRHVAWMPQAREIAWPVSVETLVALGRTPHLGVGQHASDADLAAVDRALVQMELTALRNRDATRLSGGEQGRALIARALAQETPLLMADEPIAGLDPAHQIATIGCFTALAAQGKSVIVSLHDLGLAARHCTRLIVVHDGGIVADGTADDVLTAALMRTVFGVTVWFEQTAQGPVFQPLEIVG